MRYPVSLWSALALFVLAAAGSALAQTGYDRTGLDSRKVSILDVEVPLIRIPVSPGRNLAVLIEVASLNQRLRSQGYFSAETFNKRLIERMKSKERP